MHRISIRNIKSEKTAKPRICDALIDGDEIYLEIKSKNNKNEIVAISDIMKQIISFMTKGTVPP
jgi:hypothetical protein